MVGHIAWYEQYTSETDQQNSTGCECRHQSSSGLSSSWQALDVESVHQTQGRNFKRKQSSQLLDGLLCRGMCARYDVTMLCQRLISDNSFH